MNKKSFLQPRVLKNPVQVIPFRPINNYGFNTILN